MVQLLALGTHLDLLGVFHQCRRLAFIHGQASQVGDFMLSSWNRSLGAILALVGRRGMRARASLGGIRAPIWAHHFPNRWSQWGCKLASLMQWRVRSFTFYVLGREAGFWGEGVGLLHPLAFAPHCTGAPRQGHRVSWMGSFPGKRTRGRCPQLPGRALCAASGPWTPSGKTRIFDTEVPACDWRAFALHFKKSQI